VPSTPPPRLLDLVRAALRLRHLSRRTDKAYVVWIRRFIVFHAKRHPIDMGAPEITRFLSALATERNVSRLFVNHRPASGEYFRRIASRFRESLAAHVNQSALLPIHRFTDRRVPSNNRDA